MSTQQTLNELVETIQLLQNANNGSLQQIITKLLFLANQHIERTKPAAPTPAVVPQPARTTTALSFDLPQRIPKDRWVQCLLVHKEEGSLAAPRCPLRLHFTANMVDKEGRSERDVTHLLQLELPTSYVLDAESLDFRLRFRDITKNLGGKQARLCISCEGFVDGVGVAPAAANALTIVTSRGAKQPKGLAVFFPPGKFGKQYAQRFAELGITTAHHLAALKVDKEFMRKIRNKQGPLTEEVLVAAVARAARGQSCPRVAAPEQPEQPWQPEQPQQPEQQSQPEPEQEQQHQPEQEQQPDQQLPQQQQQYQPFQQPDQPQQPQQVEVDQWSLCQQFHPQPEPQPKAQLMQQPDASAPTPQSAPMLASSQQQADFPEDADMGHGLHPPSPGEERLPFGEFDDFVDSYPCDSAYPADKPFMPENDTNPSGIALFSNS